MELGGAIGPTTYQRRKWSGWQQIEFQTISSRLGRIRIEAGGDIDVLVPGGSIAFGIENQTLDQARSRV